MPKKRLFAAFRDPLRRPRAIIWTGTALMGLIAFIMVAIPAASTFTFCAHACHCIQDDTIAAYADSPHANVSCVACHIPSKAGPATLLYLKAKDGIIGGYQRVTNTYELPINPDSALAAEMPSTQCTQCHTKTREATPRDGLIINHAVHAEENINCTTCHNRVAHPERGTLVLATNEHHDDWLSMDGCFRCHSLEAKSKAPGRCNACHAADFKLVPSSHETTSWYNAFGNSTGHAAAAHEVEKRVAAAEKAQGEKSTVEKGKAEGKEELKPLAEVNTCQTCHRPEFCSGCHGTSMPHSAAFKKDHSKQAAAAPASCGKCHARNAAEAKSLGYCNACHHPKNTPGASWTEEHKTVVKTADAKQCFTCHEEQQCSYCHVRGSEAGRLNLKTEFSLN
jgi:nitrate/TMAO reductase-like tetraheme cytochrome c subunit